jgi:hypothetical protein
MAVSRLAPERDKLKAYTTLSDIGPETDAAVRG